MGLFDRLFPQTHSTILHISSKSGFHLRPAASFSTIAKNFDATIIAETRGESVNAKQLNALLSLNLEEGDHFELICKGKDGQKALDTLVAHFENLMRGEKTKEYTLSQKPSVYHYAAPALSGVCICEGIAVAVPHHLEITQTFCESKPFDQALREAKEELSLRYASKKPEENSDIFLAQAALLDTLPAKIHNIEAFEKWAESESSRLESGILASKRSDYLDLLQRVKKHMGTKREFHLPSSPFILIADDLLPSDIDILMESPCKGVVLKETSPASHTAILLRSAGLPSLILNSSLHEQNHQIILDASIETVVLQPVPQDLTLAKQRLQHLQQKKQEAYNRRFEEATQENGEKITILANVSGPKEAKEAKANGAEGIGLLRTEFLFTEKKPTLKEQQQAYAEIFDLFDDITVRTLDVGGDKSLPYLTLPKENNPFLGIRGIRLLETHPDLIKEQLLAIFLAAKKKSLKIMFPMISTVEEFHTAKDFSHKVAKEHNLDIAHHRFGIMIEVPSVLFLIESFNNVVDFYSIGTNDLLQYLFATERTHPTLTIPQNSPVTPIVIREIIKSSDKPVSICGELAADKTQIKMLLQTGIRTLSLSTHNIPIIKETIRHV